MGKKGQSILEYVIILSVIVAAIAIAANNGLRSAVGNIVNNSATSINGSAGRISRIGVAAQS